MGTTPNPGPAARRYRPLAVGSVLLALAGGVALAAYWRFASQPPAPPAVTDDLISTAPSPYRNTRPGVAYVGDGACVACHADVAESFRHHPMGQALAPVAASEEPPPGSFDKLGFHFAVQSRDGRMIHSYERRDGQGRVVCRAEFPVQYVLGSGTRGRSYLTERDGRLVQSPISWFTQAKQWDLSPSFAGIFPGERIVEPMCAFCHANQVEPVAHARNRYQVPVFRGYSVGCERCHGPGELHVEAPADFDPVTGADRTIVNPKYLEPDLRDDVCRQCHLQGERRFPRRGRETFDYRPGLPFSDFWAVYGRSPEFSPYRKAVGHFEQMEASRCFTASGGRLGCSTCHDPHSIPVPEQRVAFFRDRCQACHESKTPCRLPAHERQARDNDCVACHMPRFPSGDIAHTAVTDHRILRRPDPPSSGKTAPRLPEPGEVPLVDLIRRGTPSRSADTERDVALALIYLEPRPGPFRDRMADLSLPLLEDAAARHPDDLPAVEALGWALNVLGRPAEALEAFQKVLEQAPDAELALILAAQTAEGSKRNEEALEFRRKLVELNPYLGEHHTELAKLLAWKQDWPGVLREAEAAVALTPAQPPARWLLVTGLVHTGQRERAARELETLIALSPKDEPFLRQWFVRMAR